MGARAGQQVATAQREQRARVVTTASHATPRTKNYLNTIFEVSHAKLQAVMSDKEIATLMARTRHLTGSRRSHCGLKAGTTEWRGVAIIRFYPILWMLVLFAWVSTGFAFTNTCN